MKCGFPAREGGMALIMVLWVISLMTIMAGSFSLSTQREAGILSHAHERSKALALADGGVNYAMMMLSLPDIKRRWQADGTPYTWQVDGARVKIRILDEGGKVDLNAAQEQTLLTVLRWLLKNEDQATAMADKIIDWRDADNLRREHGAEAPDYEPSKMQAPPQNRNFLIIDELRSVSGMTAELYRKLEGWFTLYTGVDGLNPAKASRELLMTMMGGDPAVVDGYIQERRLAAQNGMVYPLNPIPGMIFSSSADLAYTIVAVAEIQDQQGAGVSATVRRSPSANGSPFAILHWKSFVVPSKSAS